MLFSLSLINYGLMYWAHIFLARHLSINHFDDFSVAVSVVTLLSTVATLGLEKYALRVLALYIERENWPRLRGFCQFSLRAILLFSLLLMGATGVGLTVVLAWQEVESHKAILLYTAFLPAVALCLYLIETITVFGAQILALALYRFVLPSVFLLLVVSINALEALNAETVVLCFGTAWCLTLGLMLVAAQATAPKAARRGQADCHGKRWWLLKSLPLLVSSIMMTLLTSAGTIVLEILHPSEAAVGIYAVAMKSGGFISLLGTSTNRYYLPMLVVLIERRDQSGLKKLLNKRTRLLAGLTALFMAIVAVYGHKIMDLFGQAFSQGYWVLIFCAVGTAVMTLFADSLYYLQFMQRNRLVIGSMFLAVTAMLALSFVLGKDYGAEGAAIAFAAPTIALFATLKWQAHRHMRQLFSINAQA